MSVLKREDLEKYKARELAKMLTSAGVKGAHDMKKIDIINKLLELQEPTTGEQTKSEQVENEQAVAVKVAPTITNANDATKESNKTFYVENAVVGMIVAFKVDNKIKSAMIVKKSTNQRKFMLETAYKATYVVPYEDIIWVRTGARWPKGVYKALKGLSE